LLRGQGVCVLDAASFKLFRERIKRVGAGALYLTSRTLATRQGASPGMGTGLGL
jgi:hypothetical protein